MLSRPQAFGLAMISLPILQSRVRLKVEDYSRSPTTHRAKFRAVSGHAKIFLVLRHVFIRLINHKRLLKNNQA